MAARLYLITVSLISNDMTREQKWYLVFTFLPCRPVDLLLSTANVALLLQTSLSFSTGTLLTPYQRLIDALSFIPLELHFPHTC